MFASWRSVAVSPLGMPDTYLPMGSSRGDLAAFIELQQHRGRDGLGEAADAGVIGGCRDVVLALAGRPGRAGPGAVRRPNRGDHPGEPALGPGVVERRLQLGRG